MTVRIVSVFQVSDGGKSILPARILVENFLMFSSEYNNVIGDILSKYQLEEFRHFTWAEPEEGPGIIIKITPEMYPAVQEAVLELEREADKAKREYESQMNVGLAECARIQKELEKEVDELNERIKKEIVNA